MPEQPFGAFDNGNNLLARGRGVAADDMIDPLFTYQVVAGRMISGNDPGGITQVGRKGEIEIIALVDFVDRHQCALLHLTSHHRVRS